ncbi:MAG: 4Fe-4S binding protein [Planctomycetes bacterium]|nr:4Fe-4S binding protein [Planctomycetota bacterium]
MKLQILRRFVQALALVVMVALPLLSLYAHYRAARVINDDQLMAGMRGEVMTKLVHPYIDKLDDPQAFLDNNKGTFWSMQVLGVDLTDPLAALEMLATSKRFHWPLFVSIAIPVALALLLGKVFCSWICPGYVLFELTGKLRRLLRLAEIEPGNVTFSHGNKYIVLGVGLVVAMLASSPLFALIYPPAVISRAVHAWVFGTALTGMVVLLGVMVAVEVFVSPRWWCRTVCPGGALYGLLGWMRPVRIKLVKGACTGCMDCLPVCEAGINPITQSSSIECDNCGVCIRHCGPAALVFTIGLPDALSRRQKLPHPRRKAKAVAIATLLLAPLLSPNPASAHHILGLPHYSYKENYPQRPTLEYPATTGPYSVLLTSYPGIPTPGEPANLALYIKDHDAGRVYTQPITLRILQTSTFGDNTIILPPTTREPFDNEYKFHVTFPVDGEYIVELSMMVEGRLEVIPFLMVAGEPTATASVVLGASFGMILVFVVVRAVQKKKHRRAARRTQLCVA